MPLKGHPEIRVNLGCHREERSDVTISTGIALINAFGIIEAMPLWIVTHSFGMLAMTNQGIGFIMLQAGRLQLLLIIAMLRNDSNTRKILARTECLP